MTEEIWEKLGHTETIAYESWPTYDEEKTIENEKEIGVQVNGKLRGTIVVSNDTTEEEMIKLSMAEENVKKFVEGKEIVKTIVIKGKIVIIVVK